jgi:hypothetical protein
MAGTSYNKLFNTRITHTFYEKGIAKKDIGVFPTEETATTMKNANMLFRMDDQGFRVLYKAQSNGDAFIPFSNLSLVFGLKLLNLTEFPNFTDLNDTVNSKTYTAGKILYFTNRASTIATNLVYSLIDQLKPSSFTYQFPQTAPVPGDTGNTGTIVIKDSANNVVTPAPPPASTGIVSDQNGKFNYPVDFTKMPKGLYTFETTVVSPPGTVTEKIYIDTDLARGGVFGIVDILAVSEKANKYPPFPPVSQPSPPIPEITDERVYDLNFVRRLTQWKYVVVLKSAGAPAPGSVVIADDSVTPFQPPYGKLLFNSGITGPNVNGCPTVIITSTSTTIPYFEQPKKSLMIKDVTTVVVSDIPGPPLGVVSADPLNINITQIFVTI